MHQNDKKKLISKSNEIFWMSRLSDYPFSPLVDRPLLTSKAPSEYDTIKIRIPESIAAVLYKISKKDHVNIFLLFKATLHLLLYKYTGNTHLSSTSLAFNKPEIRENRNQGRVFVKSTIEPGASLGEFLKKMSAELKEILPKQDYDYIALERKIRQKMPGLADSLNDTLLSYSPLHANPGKDESFRICFHFDKQEEQITLTLLYRKHLYSEQFTEQLGRHFIRVLEKLLTASDTSVSDLQLSDDEERGKYVASLQSLITDSERYLSEETVVSYIEKQTERFSEKPALIYQGKSLSYSDLNRKANTVARYLSGLEGFSREDVLGVFIPGSDQLVVAMMGVLKSGAAFLPIDPNQPVERQIVILKECKCTRILISGDISPEIQSLPGIDLIDVSQNLSSENNYPIRLPRKKQLASVLYAPGPSPKGMKLDHESLFARTYFLTNNDNKTLTLLLNPASNGALTEIFTSLFQGGTLVIPEQGRLSDFKYILNLIQLHGITDVFVPGPYILSLRKSDSEWLRKISSLRRLYLSGPPLNTVLLDEIRQNTGAIVKSYLDFNEAPFALEIRLEVEDFGQYLIGTPSAGYYACVLDQYDQPVPPGVTGEICIGGSSLAGVYVNDTQQTTGKLITSQLFLGHTLLKTGLKAKETFDKQFLVQGNNQELRQIHGAPIAKEEIIQALIVHDKVLGATVLIKKNEKKHEVIVACVVTEDGEEPTESLQEFLADRLPLQMIPDRFCYLADFPLTGDHRIDLQSLPEFFASKSIDRLGPQSSEEKNLLEIFQNILGSKNVSPDDNFFELGGHSIQAMQLLGMINDAFGINLSLTRLIRASDIRELALMVRTETPKNIEDQTGLSKIEGDSSWNRFLPYPMSLIQQAYWMGQSAAFELGVRSMIHIEEVHEELDFSRFTASVRRLIGRHEMLRTVVLDDGQQKELNYSPLYTPAYLDFSGRRLADQKAGVEELRTQMWQKKISPGDWPLFEIAVVNEGEAGCRLVFMIDLIICDASSLNQLQEELWLIYQNQEKSLKNLSFSYRDYILWEEGFRNSKTYMRSKAYWQDRIAQFAGVPELPVMHDVLPWQQSYVSYESRLDKKAWQNLKRLSAEHKVTPTAVLLTLFSDILGRWSSNDRFAINMTTFNRPPIHEDINRLIGDFTGVSLLEIDVYAGESFWDRAGIIQMRLWQDMEHYHYGGIEVIRDLTAKRGAGAGRMPVVFTSTLGLEEFQDTGRGSRVYAGSRTSQVWIDHQVTEFANELLYTWTVVDNLFPQGMMRKIFDCYRDLLSALACSGEPKGISTESLVHKEYREYAPLHMLSHIWEQVNHRGDSEAVVNGSVRITYRHLWKMSQEISSHFLPDVEHIGIVMDKGWEQIVAVISVLRSGSAYVPIDWSWPAARIKNLIDEAGIRQVVTQEKIFDEVNSLCEDDINVITVSTDLLKETLADPEKGTWSAPSALAYIIFTSGSTGRPKGVMIDHAAVMNTIEDINRRFAVNDKDRVLGLSSLSFDLSVFDIFGVLGAGGTLVIPENRLDVEEWKILLKSEKITLWNTVPSLMEILIDHPGLSEKTLDSLRLILLSGDWIPVDLPKKIVALQPASQVISLGGATECSIWSVFHKITERSVKMKSIPYGKGLANQWLYVLNEKLQECPMWVKGDIYIGGEGLAKGYWADKEKTALQFINHPTTDERLYKTGDKGRYLSDGEIEFLGREDNQVKIGGYRIEIGEIESTLKQHPRVKDAVAVVYGSGHNRAIGACVTLNSGNEYLKNLSGERKDIELGGLRNAGKKPELVANTSASTDGLRLSLSDLGELLSIFAERYVDEVPLAKYRYPSAGSLYPVQVYLSIGNHAVEGLESGNYYYDRRRHRLLLVSPHSESTAGISLFPVMFLPAIGPVYGIRSFDFGYIEWGHMMAMIGQVAGDLQLSPTDTGSEYDSGFIRSSFKLDSRYMILGGITFEKATRSLQEKNVISKKQNGDKSLPDIDEDMVKEWASSSESLLSFKLKKLGSREFSDVSSIGLGGSDTQSIKDLYLRRQSFRSFSWEQVKLSSIQNLLEKIPVYNHQIVILIEIMSGMIEGVPGGLYSYRQSGQRLEVLPDNTLIHLYGETNRDIFATGSFGIFLLHASGERLDSLILSGYIGQLLMENAPDQSLGLCPLGIDGEDHFVGGHGEVIYSFVGGRIEPSQLSEWHPEVVPSLEKSIIQQLKGYMKSGLPEYMLPGHYEVLDSLPLTNNAKVDKNALIKLLESRVVSDNEKVREGRDEVEKKLLRIWREFLGHNQLGPADNLFESGCNSLTALRALTSISSEFGVKLNLENVYENSSVEALGAIIKAAAWTLHVPGEEDTDLEETFL